MALLREIVRTVDTLERLDALVRAEGLMTSTSQGPRVHPAVAESRQQRIALARLQAALALPAGEDESEGVRRPHRRTAPRGVYGLKAAR